MTLRWDPRAIQDLREIGRYIAAHGSRAAANRVRRHLQARVDRLRTKPRLGAASINPDIRVLNPIRYPYRIYYTVQGGDVVILHIRHTSRQSPGDLTP